MLSTMKRKLDKKKLVLEQNTVTVLTTDQFDVVRGGGQSERCDGGCQAQACGRGDLTGRRC
jgi:hypothetical protein